MIVWRSRDTLKEEGDPNYLALAHRLHDVPQGARLRRGGLTRRFTPAPGVDLFAAVRLHRTESHYEYSYRIVGRVRLRHRF